jgi:hypothetical protein
MASGAIRIVVDNSTADALIDDGVVPAQTAYVATQNGPLVDSKATEVQVMSTASSSTMGIAAVIEVNVTITGGETLIDANVNRKSVVIQSFDPSSTNPVVYIGGDSTLTTANGIALLDGDTYTDDRWTGPINAIVTSGTANIRVWERL